MGVPFCLRGSHWIPQVEGHFMCVLGRAHPLWGAPFLVKGSNNMCIDNPNVFSALAALYCKEEGAACMARVYGADFYVVTHVDHVVEYVRSDGWVKVLIELGPTPPMKAIVLFNDMPLFYEKEGEDRSRDCWSRILTRYSITANDIASALRAAAAILY